MERTGPGVEGGRSVSTAARPGKMPAFTQPYLAPSAADYNALAEAAENWVKRARRRLYSVSAENTGLLWPDFFSWSLAPVKRLCCANTSRLLITSQTACRRVSTFFFFSARVARQHHYPRIYYFSSNAGNAVSINTGELV